MFANNQVGMAGQLLSLRPIIEQDVARIWRTWWRAVRWHLDRRIFCYGNKTVVFDSQEIPG